jgi:hypothetical protein
MGKVFAFPQSTARGLQAEHPAMGCGEGLFQWNNLTIGLLFMFERRVTGLAC